jgi:hypothetical protein
MPLRRCPFHSMAIGNSCKVMKMLRHLNHISFFVFLFLLSYAIFSPNKNFWTSRCAHHICISGGTFQCAQKSAKGKKWMGYVLTFLWDKISLFVTPPKIQKKTRNGLDRSNCGGADFQEPHSEIIFFHFFLIVSSFFQFSRSMAHIVPQRGFFAIPHPALWYHCFLWAILRWHRRNMNHTLSLGQNFLFRTCYAQTRAQNFHFENVTHTIFSPLLCERCATLIRHT